MSNKNRFSKIMGKIVLLLSALLLVNPGYSLAQVLPEYPDAGKTLDGLHQTELALPDRKEMKLQVAEVEPRTEQDAAQRTNEEKFWVKGFKITGQSVFDEQELLALLVDGQDKESSLTDVENFAIRLTNYCHERGYIMARAYVPAQRIDNGIVEIALLIGKYDEIIIRKHFAIEDSIIKLQLQGIGSGEYITKSSLDKGLWLLTDLAGAEVKATLAPGRLQGTANLVLDINPKGKLITGMISADNYGNVFTGRNQINTNVNILNPSHRGDVISVNGVTTGGGLNSGSISWQMPVFAPGDRLELGCSHMVYELGGVFEALHYKGSADTVSIGYNHAFKRSAIANLYGNITYSHKNLQDIALFTTDKRSDAITFSLKGDSVDDWGGGGANSYSLSYTRGWLADNDDNSALAGTAGHFGKWSVTAARQQYIHLRLSLISSFNAQLATKNLDSSEKLSLGGPYGVRAFPKGEASGDTGYLWSTELHWVIPSPSLQNTILQAVCFYDLGWVKLNQTPFSSGNTYRTLQGAGLGLILNKQEDYSAKLYYAWRIGAEEAKSDGDKQGRWWLQVAKRI